jgi:hypothetical protein
MSARPSVEERYTNGSDTINYVVYRSKTGGGNDEVLQHKLLGMTETAHITLHPDGTVNFRIARARSYLEIAVATNMLGYRPEISAAVRDFIVKVRGKL